MSSNERIQKSGEEGFSQTPFAALKSDGLPDAPPEAPSHKTASQRTTRAKDRGRVDILRQTAHRGGKTVTVVKNFVGIGLPEKEQLAKQMQKACGCGGTVKDGEIEIQGDQRERVAAALAALGYKTKLVGG